MMGYGKMVPLTTDTDSTDYLVRHRLRPLVFLMPLSPILQVSRQEYDGQSTFNQCPIGSNPAKSTRFPGLHTVHLPSS